MTSSHRRPALLAALTLGVLASAAGVSAAQTPAPVISVDKACYVHSASATPAEVTVSGDGFPAGDSVKISATGFSTTATAAADGSFTATGPAPVFSSGPVSKTYQLTAADQTHPGVTAQTTLRVANLAVAVNRSRVNNVRKDKVTFSFAGFDPSKHIYGYYIHGKAVARAVFRKAQGPCGMLRQRALLYPGGRPRHNTYKVVFEDTSRYSATAFPRVTGNLQLIHF
jgi:hypothetical protein